MIEPLDNRFESMVGKRLNFIGRLDEITQVTKYRGAQQSKKWRVTFCDIYEKDTGKKFRQHTHIMISAKDYQNNFKEQAKINVDEFAFSAEIYIYRHRAKKHYDKKSDKVLIYQELGIGLKDAKGFKKIK